MVNGFTSEAIRIERGVKQGDALSCAIFIICIDPVLRNINSNDRIKKVALRIRTPNLSIKFKAAAYADDISVVCLNDNESINQIFLEYERLTVRSGLELNADKTEILNLESNEKVTIRFKYNGNRYALDSVNGIKICGIYYCNEENEEYRHNVLDKIEKLSNKIKVWTNRHLTMEGKVLIMKTFGLSQLIYNMQSYEFHEKEIISIERLMFGFLWSTVENKNGRDRIKRAIMKNDYDKGGMRVTDIECLNKSLKLKQFLRASKSNHVIAKIQAWVTNSNEGEIKQDYVNITKSEMVCNIAQETINIITDHNRSWCEGLEEEEYENDRNLINEIASIDISAYLTRKKRVFAICINKQLIRAGVESLGELLQAYEFEIDEKMTKMMTLTLANFPPKLIKIAKCYNDESRINTGECKFIQMSSGMRMDLKSLTVRELQNSLKAILKKTETSNFTEKLGTNFDANNINRLRINCKNPKLRNIYFRLIHNDFFTRVRMKKYGMVNDDVCQRCGEVETMKHQIWECTQAKNIWQLYNELMVCLGENGEEVDEYNSIYVTPEGTAITQIKIRIIQEMIQIARPNNWGRCEIRKLVKDLINMELYNSKQNSVMHKFKLKWNEIEIRMKQY
jgi:hypothetical protein